MRLANQDEEAVHSELFAKTAHQDESTFTLSICLMSTSMTESKLPLKEKLTRNLGEFFPKKLHS